MTAARREPPLQISSQKHSFEDGPRNNLISHSISGCGFARQLNSVVAVYRCHHRPPGSQYMDDDTKAIMSVTVTGVDDYYLFYGMMIVIMMSPPSRHLSVVVVV